MDFTRNNFIEFWKRIVPFGGTIDLDVLDCFGYFEAEPYKGVIIRYNFEKVTHNREGITFDCKSRIRNFDLGSISINEDFFNRYAKEIRVLGNYPEEWTNDLNY